ncbi:cytoplasmic dynein 2 intermediate chain 2-like [Palaemon carinicauda]|uniref:cytoplasmic dynein 2 intermediate chain 2-like n=1 Tax=Palaemon carinicauda TaxID=392227 RepID=UPI0035B6A3E5
MFSKKSGGGASFSSNWKTEQSLADGGCQTDPVELAEEGCQVLELSETGVQTEEEQTNASKAPEYNEESLLMFLKSVGPKVIREIERQNRSRAFDGFSLLEKEESSGGKILHTLRLNQLQSNHVVTGIDWSCTGSVVVVAYGSRFHEDWCDHKGVVTTWNINRSDFDSNQPEKLIEVSSCVLCVAFHPTNPAVFAVGTYSGELLIFDLSHSESVSPVVVGDCRGCVTALSWIASGGAYPKTPNSVAASTSTGFILLFELNLLKSSLKLKSGFMLQSQDVPRGIRGPIDETEGVEVTSASFNKEDPTLFVIGAEGGGLFVCSTTSEVPAGKEFDEVRLVRCVTSVLSPHTGRVLASQFSPHHHNAVLSSASDNQIRLFSILQPNKPVNVIYSEEIITCAELSPSRPMVVAVGLVTGQVALHDFGMKSCQPFLSLRAAEKPASITYLKFNKKDMALLAVGDRLGRVSIWHLPDNAVSPLSTEQTALSSLLDTVTE